MTSENNSTGDLDTLSKETIVNGYLTGDHECGLIHPQMPLPRRRDFESDDAYRKAKQTWRDTWDDRLYLEDILPDGIEDGTYKFHIHVEAVPTSNETNDN